MRLYQKAKRLGTWDPAAIDFSRDRELWAGLSPDEQGAILQITSLFQAGEEGVTLDLLPLIMVVAEEGRLEEELFLTTFLWEEGKHGFHTPSYRVIFYEELPAAMNRLRDDRSPEAQIRAAVTYNMIVEGVLAETGYQSYFLALERNDLMPGLREGLAHVKRDESRHIAYGVHLLSRLVDSDPALWEVAEARMAELLPYALSFIEETFAGYGPTSPFGVRLDELSEFAQSQFSKRLDRIRRGAAHEEVAL